MAKFEATHDFILATPDGELPQLDINGVGLAMHGMDHLGAVTARIALQAGLKRLSPEKIRAFLQLGRCFDRI